MSEDPAECPLCMEALEIDDHSFFPCTCGYQICRFCWHRIRTDENGLCPACRKQYAEDPAEFKPLTEDEFQNIKKGQKQKDVQRKQKAAENRKHLANVRVVQKNLVFVVGLSPRMADPDVLKKQEYFGKFGKIHKVVINQSTSYAGSQGPSASAYVTYVRPEDALKAILTVNNVHVDGRTLKISLGTTKYCSHFLKGSQCQKSECMYLHELGEGAASFTKEEMQAGKHQEYEQMLIEQFLNSQNTANNHHTVCVNNKVKKPSSPQGTEQLGIPSLMDMTGDIKHTHTGSCGSLLSRSGQPSANELTTPSILNSNWPVVDGLSSNISGGQLKGDHSVLPSGRKKVQRNGSVTQHRTVTPPEPVSNMGAGLQRNNSSCISLEESHLPQNITIGSIGTQSSVSPGSTEKASSSPLNDFLLQKSLLVSSTPLVPLFGEQLPSLPRTGSGMSATPLIPLVSEQLPSLPRTGSGMSAAPPIPLVGEQLPSLPRTGSGNSATPLVPPVSKQLPCLRQTGSGTLATISSEKSANSNIRDMQKQHQLDHCSASGVGAIGSSRKPEINNTQSLSLFDSSWVAASQSAGTATAMTTSQLARASSISPSAASTRLMAASQSAELPNVCQTNQEMTDSLPVSSGTDWSAAFGFRNREFVAEDDLGFDPCAESFKGLADLMEKENGMKGHQQNLHSFHQHQQKSLGSPHSLHPQPSPFSTRLATNTQPFMKSVPPGFSIAHLQMQQQQEQQRYFGRELDRSKMPDVLPLSHQRCPPMPGFHHNLPHDLHIQQHPQYQQLQRGEPYSMKDMQEQLRCMLPNINISFGSLRHQQPSPLFQGQCFQSEWPLSTSPEQSPWDDPAILNTSTFTESPGMFQESAAQWLKSLQLTEFDIPSTQHVPLVPQLPMAGWHPHTYNPPPGWQAHTYNPPPGFGTMGLPGHVMTDTHKMAEVLQ